MREHWPQNSRDPLGIKNEFSWSEYGALFRIIGEQRVTLMIETGVGAGDLAAWMIAKSTFDPEFTYLGITNDPTMVDQRVVTQASLNKDHAFIATGAPCGKVILDRVGRMIRNSSGVMVLCDGTDIEREVDHYLPLLRSGDVIVAHHFLELYKGRRLMDMHRTDQLRRITGDWMNRTRLIAGVIA